MLASMSSTSLWRYDQRGPTWGRTGVRGSITIPSGPPGAAPVEKPAYRKSEGRTTSWRRSSACLKHRIGGDEHREVVGVKVAIDIGEAATLQALTDDKSVRLKHCQLSGIEPEIGLMMSPGDCEEVHDNPEQVLYAALRVRKIGRRMRLTA